MTLLVQKILSLFTKNIIIFSFCLSSYGRFTLKIRFIIEETHLLSFLIIFTVIAIVIGYYFEMLEDFEMIHFCF